MPSLLVVALAVLMAVVLPTINRRASYRHPVRSGDIAALADGITIVPAAGWDLATGALVGQTRSRVGSTGQTELVDGSVKFDVQAAPFAGTPSGLLRRVTQISAHLNHTRGGGSGTRSYTVTTRQGAVGVGQDFVGVSRQGTVVAFVFRSRDQTSSSGGQTGSGQTTGEGVEIVASGPKGPISRGRDAVVAMIRSLRTAQ